MDNFKNASSYLCVGSAEKFDYILSGAREMKAFLENNSFTGLQFEYYEFAGETHNSEVPVALNRILASSG